MKPPRFDYAAPASLDEAVRLLAARNGAAKVLSGGQSLMPLLAFRLAAPELLVDLKKVRGLDTITIGADGVTLGARVRWVDIEGDARLARAHPLLAEAVRHVAHYQIRNRGTVGGSVAHADPAAELPGIVVTCDAAIDVIGAKGRRTIAAGEFFIGPLQTALGADEIITGIRLPAWPAGRRWSFLELSRRKGDFAMAGVALYYDLDQAGRAAGTRVGVIGAGGTPGRLASVERLIDGSRVDDEAIAKAAAEASRAVEPGDDVHAPAAYRRSLVGTLVERGLKRARAG